VGASENLTLLMKEGKILKKLAVLKAVNLLEEEIKKITEN